MTPQGTPVKAAIDPSTYDGKRHAIPFTVGDDFVAKWSAYRGDGFTCSVIGEHIHVIKCMGNSQGIPSDIVWHE